MAYQNTLTVSQEFFSPKEFFSNIPTFLTQLKDFVSKDTKSSKPVYKLPNYKQIKSKVEKKAPEDLREYKVFIPLGLKVPMYQYINVLEEGVEISEKLLEDVLTPFSRWLALGLTNPSTLRSVRGGINIDKFNPHNIDQVYDSLGKCFEKGSNVINLPFKRVYSNKKDFEDTFNKFDAATSLLFKTERKLVISKIVEITENLEKLMERIKEDEEGYELSNVSTGLLSKLSFTLAQEVEFFGVMHYQMNALNTSLVDTVDTFKKVL